MALFVLPNCDHPAPTVEAEASGSNETGDRPTTSPTEDDDSSSPSSTMTGDDSEHQDDTDSTPQPAILHGRLVDLDGKPPSGLAFCALCGPISVDEDGEQQLGGCRAFQSDAEGRFELTTFETGEYKLSISATTADDGWPEGASFNEVLLPLTIDKLADEHEFARDFVIVAMPEMPVDLLSTSGWQSVAIDDQLTIDVDVDATAWGFFDPMLGGMRMPTASAPLQVLGGQAIVAAWALAQGSASCETAPAQFEITIDWPHVDGDRYDLWTLKHSTAEPERDCQALEVVNGTLASHNCGLHHLSWVYVTRAQG